MTVTQTIDLYFDPADDLSAASYPLTEVSSFRRAWETALTRLLRHLPELDCRMVDAAHQQSSTPWPDAGHEEDTIERDLWQSAHELTVRGPRGGWRPAPAAAIRSRAARLRTRLLAPVVAGWR